MSIIPRTSLRPSLTLGALVLALYLPGLVALPPTDRDEARFAQASRQMLESGDFIRIRFQDEPRYRKPPLVYWLQAAAVAAVSDAASRAIWPYRLPSLLGALAAVALTFLAGSILFGPGAALAASAALAACTILVGEAHVATSDAVLLAVTCAAMALLARVRRDARAGRDPGRLAALGFWATVGAGVLVKGPLTPLVALSAVAALAAVERDGATWRALRPAAGVPLALAIAAPWFVAVVASGEGGPLSADIGRDLLGKLARGQEGHGAPPGTHAALLPLGFWPGSLLLVPALVAAWRDRSDPAVRFCLAWLVPSWLVFELVPTKLPHYALPLYPALALLAGRFAVGLQAGRAVSGRGLDMARWIGFALWAVSGLALGAAAALIPLAVEGRVAPWGVACALAVVVTIAAVLPPFRRRRYARALTTAIVGAVAFYAVLLEGVLPETRALWPSSSAAELVERARRGGAPIVVAGYREPSLVFLLGIPTRITTPREAARRLAEEGALALVERRVEPEFRQALEERAVAAGAGGSAGGWNVNEGRRVRLTLYERGP